jgi:hypothetical protein
MNLILTRILFEFDLELVDDKFNWMDQRVFTLWRKPPLSIILKERAS